MLTVFKRIEFCYAHSLPGHKGKCCNMHGHNSVWEVGAIGVLYSNPIHFLTKETAPYTLEPCDYTDMVLDYKDLSFAMKSVADQVDHSFLNDLFEYPTSENLIKWLIKKIVTEHKIAVVESTLWESSTSYVRWRRG